LEKTEGKFYLQFDDTSSPSMRIYDGFFIDENKIDLDITGGNFSNETMLYEMDQA